MKRTKICFVSLYAYHLFKPSSKTKFGGAEVQLYYLATELAQDPRFDIYFVVGDFGQPDVEIIQGVKLYKCFHLTKGFKYPRAFCSNFRLVRLLEKIDADIYIQRAAGLITGMLGLFCRFRNKKFIYMIAHDVDTERKAQYGRSWLWWKIFHWGLLSADLVITQHENQAEALMKQYRKKSKIRRSAHHIPQDVDSVSKDSIVWVARCDTWKQPELFIETAKQFPYLSFIMICPESLDNYYFKRIQVMASKAPNIQFIEFVPFYQIDEFFLRARIFINTSIYEGFPNTFIQAAKNKAVILSLNVNPSGILEKNRMGICASGGFKKMKGYLGILLANDTMWREMADNAYRYVKENHNIVTIIEEDKKTFLSLVEQ